MSFDPNNKGCCTPAGSSDASRSSASHAVVGKTRVAEDAVHIPGGKALKGTSRPEILDDGEDPVRNTRVKPFRIGATTVTNAQFAKFIDATNYVTEAERFGWSFVFFMQVPKSFGGSVAKI